VGGWQESERLEAQRQQIMQRKREQKAAHKK